VREKEKYVYFNHEKALACASRLRLC